MASGSSRLPAAGTNADADDEFEAYVADLILADAKAKQAAQQARGAGSGSLRRTFFDPSAAAAAASGSGPRPINKRLLSNVIRDVDSHNKNVLRQQQHAADEANARRLQAEASQGSSRSSSGLFGTQDGMKSRARGSAYPATDLNNRASAPPRPQRLPTELDLPDSGSKMDRYFDSAYDPALDIDMSRLEDPHTGLIGQLPDLLLHSSSSSAMKGKNADSAKWGDMLAVVKQRDADKAARKAERAERRAKKAERAVERER
ncbi:unnamed protein product, partial [Tilletia caries]